MSDRRSEGFQLGDVYRCAKCREEFEINWSDEDALEEATEAFGGEDDGNWDGGSDVVCDDCYKELMGSPVVQ